MPNGFLFTTEIILPVFTMHQPNSVCVHSLIDICLFASECVCLCTVLTDAASHCMSITIDTVIGAPLFMSRKVNIQ